MSSRVPAFGVVVAGSVWVLAQSCAMAAPLGLPGVPVGSIVQGTTGTLGQTTRGLGSDVDNTLDVARDAVGRPRVTRLLDRDLNGARIVRGEIVAVAPNAQSLATLQRLNFAIVRKDTLAGLGLQSVVLRAPGDMSIAEALQAIRKADPAGVYDYDHLYDPSGAEETTAESPREQEALSSARAIRIGMIDGGVVKSHPAFHQASVISKNLAGKGDGIPTAHGTAVASLLVGDDDEFHGALPGATLYAADAFGGEATGGSADDIVRALDWLAANKVAVVNISLAGPPNALLEAGVKAFLARGHVLVAAAGNNGPAAPPAYPAGYDGVAGVTSVDADHHVQIDANRGDVSFAALGVDVNAARPQRSYTEFTGTSFAAPAVAARFALILPQPARAHAVQAWQILQRSALPLGKPGRDPVTGYGFLASPSMLNSTVKLDRADAAPDR